MSNQFSNEAKSILESAPDPDADAGSIKEHVSLDAPKKRGRPAGSGNSGKKVTPSKKVSNASPQEFEATAKAVNTIIFSMSCAVTGTSEAWPPEDKAKVVDAALSRYLSIKGLVAPPEVALFAAYAQYFSFVSQQEKVRENVKKRFSDKFGFIKKLFVKVKPINPK